MPFGSTLKQRMRGKVKNKSRGRNGIKGKNKGAGRYIGVVLSCGMPEKSLWSREGMPHHLSTWMCKLWCSFPADI